MAFTVYIALNTRISALTLRKQTLIGFFLSFDYVINQEYDKWELETVQQITQNKQPNWLEKVLKCLWHEILDNYI